MKEGPLKELSPRELNRMFRQLYADVPYKYPSFWGSHIDAETVWPLAENCRKRFQELIKFANITSAFHDFLEHDFINYTDYETGGLNDNLWQVHSLLDLSVPDSGGIFDSVRVKEIERLAYLEKIKYFFNHIAIDRGEFNPNLWSQLFVGRLRRWRNEYIVKYRDEP